MRGHVTAVSLWAALTMLVVFSSAACAPAEQAASDPSAERSANDQETEAEEHPHPGPIAPDEGPFDPGAQIRPDLVEAHPDRVSPGEYVELHYPEESSRGVGFVLEERVDATWEVRYFLTVSDREDPDDPAGSWLPPDNPDRQVWPDIGVEGPGPGFALIPGTASAGEYRICTAMQPENFCVEITVTQ